MTKYNLLKPFQSFTISYIHFLKYHYNPTIAIYLLRGLSLQDIAGFGSIFQWKMFMQIKESSLTLSTLARPGTDANKLSDFIRACVNQLLTAVEPF